MITTIVIVSQDDSASLVVRIKLIFRVYRHDMSVSDSQIGLS